MSDNKSRAGQKDARKAVSVEMRAYRFCGHPTPEQAHILNQTIGSCRFIWNRMLADTQAYYRETGKRIHLTPAAYKRQPETAWLREVDSLALANVQLRLEKAFQRFFDSSSSHSRGLKAGFPKFKKKHKCSDSYTTNLANRKNPNIRLNGCMLKLPKIKEPIKLKIHRKILPGGLLKSVTITHEPSGKWYFSLLFEYALEEQKETPAKSPEEYNHIGLDMSLPKLYMDSNHNAADFHKTYRMLEARIAREQHKLSHMQKGSSNYDKQLRRIAKLHAKAKHQRNDMLHKLSFRLTEQYDVISIEDLNMAGMKRALRFGKSVSDNGWGKFVTMLAYKAIRKGKRLIKVDRWFPSSKMCIACGNIYHELTISDRTYLCPKCGHVMDRDYQAALNIDKMGFQMFLESIKAA